MLIRILLWSVLSFICSATLSEAHYDEVLELTPLPSNYLHASFRFNVSRTLPRESKNYDVLPRSLIQATRSSRTSAVHLRFSRGRWNQQIWGTIPHQGHSTGGTGIEVWASIDSETASDDWANLVNSLSGLFCASINFIDTTRTVKPQLAFKSEHAGQVFFGVLPSETVCTENLTPFLKLLPCKGHAGIASLLTGHKLFDTDWSSMAVDVSYSEDEVIVSQSVDMVFDLDRALSAARHLVPGSQPNEELTCKEDKEYTSDVTCFPQDGRNRRDWSFVQIFGKPLNSFCAASDRNVPQLIIHHGSNARLVPHASDRQENSSRYELQHEQLNLQMFDRSEPLFKPAPFEVHRSLTSHGSSLHGKITLSVTNRRDADIDVIYFSVLPWFLRPYLHTLRTNHDNVIQDTRYLPAKDRIRPTHLELKLRIPRRETVQVTFDFDRTVLRYAEYPPDANRGFDIPAAIILSTDGEYEARTTSLLLSLPTPDFSMPYNVIILTCTVVALCFGSMFNLLSRRIVLASDVPPKPGFSEKWMALKDRVMPQRRKTTS